MASIKGSQKNMYGRDGRKISFNIDGGKNDFYLKYSDQSEE